MALAAGIGSAAGSAGGSIGSAIGAAMQRKDAKEMFYSTQDFQERMYRTRYQNTMRDMRLAGLNPILAYKQGVGPAMSGGSSVPGTPNVLAGMGGDVRSAMRIGQELRNLKLQGDQAQATIRHADAQVVRENQTAKKLDTENRLLQYMEPGARAQGEFDASKPGQFFRELNRVIDGLGPLATGAMGYFLRGKTNRATTGGGRGRAGNVAPGSRGTPRYSPDRNFLNRPNRSGQRGPTYEPPPAPRRRRGRGRRRR